MSKKTSNFLTEFIRFSRIHTIIGTTLSVTVLLLIAWFISPVEMFPVGLWLMTLVACLGANIYIVGLNQITDIEIDKINKPYLPLASGAFSLKTGYVLIWTGLSISLVLAVLSGRYLVMTVIFSLILGTAYSLPPFRLKRFYFWAAFCIIAVRGLIVNILLYLHFQYSLDGNTVLPAAIILLTVAMFVYSIIIAWFKDIPDMKGDAAYNIKTVSIQLGARRVFRWGNILLGIILLALVVYPFLRDTGLNPYVMAVTHGLMFLILLLVSWRTNPESHDAIRKYYLFIWGLFFGEYLSFALATGMG